MFGVLISHQVVVFRKEWKDVRETIGQLQTMSQTADIPVVHNFFLFFFFKQQYYKLSL